MRTWTIVASLALVLAGCVQDEADGGPSSGDAQPTAAAFQPMDPTSPCSSIGPPHFGLADAAGLTSGWAPLVLDGIIVADPSFVETHPANWTESLLDLVAQASAYYEADLDIRLNVTLVTALPPGSLEPAPAGAVFATGFQRDMRSTARGFLAANHPNVTADFVAVVLGADYAGEVNGEGECIGGAMHFDTSYFWVEAIYPTSSRTFAHELGHLLDGQHHLATCGEALDAGEPRRPCDIMATGGVSGTQFGTTHRLVLRGFVEGAGIGSPDA